jgi:Abnormal spindle-like microcephaly-assoc'd, ASPM-SPD-2-Hydin
VCRAIGPDRRTGQHVKVFQQKGTIMLRVLTVLVLGCVLVSCSSSTAPSRQTQAGVATVASVPGGSVAVSTTSVDFGNQTVNTTSAPRAVTVINTGSMPQPVNGRINGMPGQWQGFASASDCPTMLAVGASCIVNVTFTPTAKGGWGAYLVVDGINDEEAIINIGGIGT